MTILTRADFARHLGVNRSTVTRWAERGHLVLADGGAVDLEASLARLEDTTGVRPDVAARHAAARAQGAAPAAVAGEGEAGSGGATAPRGGETRTEAQARKESAAADLLEIELAQKRGEVIPKEDVDAALKALGASVRAKLDVLPDQLAPLLAPVADLDEVHAILAEHCRGLLAAVADELGRAAASGVGV